ncbi:DUF262 domain-containing protein [Candidatus Bipolaricaulota bacterium]|nr:DUF262 domain-containing protein [Candidatus Bipolaricaulota bacterium]
MAEIGSLLDKVESNEIVLPEFQREFVWRKDQSKELIRSLYKKYPIGSLLVWNTENPPEIKNDAVDREKYGLSKVLLDGQQRLTVLYMFAKNKIPPYYKEHEINADPRNLYFNLENGDFKYANKAVRENLEWVKVTDIFKGEVREFEIAKKKAEDFGNEIVEKAQSYQNHLKKIENITSHHLPVQELPKSANVHQSINLFHLVNDQGTELGEAELALAHMSAHWPHVRREVKKKRRELADKGFEFGLDFYVKCIIAITTNSMTYEKVYATPKEKLVETWNRLGETLDYLVNVLQNEAYIQDSSFISTTAALIPFVYYIDRKDLELADREKRKFFKWLYAALMWSRYGGSTDTKLEKDISFLTNENPTEELMEEIKSDRGRIELQPGDLDGRGKRSRQLYNMLKIVSRSNDPVDWKTGAPLKGSYRLESHHIFPKSQLYGNLYNSKNYMARKRVNEIANRAFITPKGNKRLSNKLPENYLPAVKEEHPEALDKQFIPENPELWKLDNYEYFLANRRKIISEAINDFMDSLVPSPIGPTVATTEELIRKGENSRIEFKETLIYDVHQNQPNRALKEEIVKEICAFANSDGGTLIIGVEDGTKDIKGIERDLKLMNDSKDKFELTLNQVTTDKLGESFTSMYVRLEFEEIEDKTLAIVSVEPSPEPVYFEGQRFYVRSGTSSRPLSMEQAMDYIEQNWQ